MILALDIALFLGIAANAVTLGDLLLRRKQRELLESALETLTLRMDYARPLQWFRSLGKPERWPVLRTVLILFTALEFLLLALNPRIDALVFFGRQNFFTILFSCFLASGCMIWLYGRVPAAWLLEDVGFPAFPFWLCGSGTFVLMNRYYLVVAAIYVPILLIAALLPRDLPFVFLILGVGGTLSVGFIILLLILLLVPLVAFRTVVEAAMLLCVLSDLSIKMARGLAWRIVEYNKGPLAALILLATFVIGVAEFLVRKGN